MPLPTAGNIIKATDITENYLPLTAGSSKKLTNNLYIKRADNGYSSINVERLVPTTSGINYQGNFGLGTKSDRGCIAIELINDDTDKIINRIALNERGLWFQNGSAAIFDSYNSNDAENNYEGSISPIPYFTYGGLGTTAGENSTFYEKVLSKLVATYPNCTNRTWIGLNQPGSRNLTWVMIYDTSKTSDGLPQYSTGFIVPYNGEYLYTFGTKNYVYYYRRVSTTAVSS